MTACTYRRKLLRLTVSPASSCSRCHTVEPVLVFSPSAMRSRNGSISPRTCDLATGDTSSGNHPFTSTIQLS